MIYKLATLEEVISNTDSSLPVFMDTETIGLYGQIRLLQVYQEHWDRVLIVDRPNPFAVCMYLEQNNTIWHNAHYDITVSQQQTNSKFCPTNFEDTFLASRLALPNYESYSLDSVFTYVLGYDPYEDAELDKKTLQKSDWSNNLTKDQLLYAAIDVYYMPYIWDTVKHVTDDFSYKLDKSFLRCCLDFQWNGMPIDEDRHNEEYQRVNEELFLIHMPVNANSWQQVRSWLGVDKSDGNYLALLALRDGNTKAERVIKVRKLRKLLSFLDRYDVTRLFGKFKPSARSGRCTSDDDNLQQIPRALKKIFGYKKGEGRVLIYSDYAQLELRTIAAILNVIRMVQLFRENVDLHGYVAEALFGATYDADDRQVTKTYNFNLLYGGSVGMVLSILIKFGFWIEQTKASRHKAKWLNLFPEINKWQQECISKWRKGKLNSTPGGRSYKSKLMTDFMNIQNQGAGAEVAKLATHYFYNWLKDQDYDVYIVNFVHDSFIIDAPDDPEIYEAVSLKLAECMQEAWFEMSKLFKVKDLPMPVNVKVGYNWGDIEKGIDVIYNLDLEPYKMLGK